MGKALDIRMRSQDLERYVGKLVLQMWQFQRQIEVLEQRVDELDGPEESGPEYRKDA